VKPVQYLLLPAVWPLSLVWRAVVTLRAGAYRRGLLRQRRLDGRVISVGNLTVGGTGKTPMVLWLMERLAKEGKTAGVLARGYTGFLQSWQSEGREVIFGEDNYTTECADGATGAARLPDEACLLIRRLHATRQERRNAGPAAWFGIGADRYSAGKQLQEKGVEWFVLDDGFQHLQLERDADIVLIDAENPFDNGQVLPAGALREPVSALRRADVIVITRSDGSPATENEIRGHTGARVFYARTKLDAIRRIGAGDGAEESVLSLSEYSSHRFFAICGIGNPRAFFADARQWGLSLCGEQAYPDHHRYSQKDGEQLEKQAKHGGATALLCTEKDACNGAGEMGVNLPVYCAQISLDLPRGDEFWRVVTNAAERNPAKAVSGGR
jgi:tetraacyldisaccharide 4'-kinase